MSNVTALQTRVHKAWDDYLAALERAQQSRDLRDGIEAGRAWARFLNEFDVERRAIGLPDGECGEKPVA